MSLVQFLRILYARKWMILAIFLATFSVAAIVGNSLPKRYPATARVFFELNNRDALTGLGVSGREMGTFIGTQVELIKDMRVMGQVVDQLGLATDPGTIAAYERSGRSDLDGGIRRWVGQSVARNISVRVPAGSVMEIVYTSNNPVQGRRVVEAVRSAYLDAALRLRTDMAARTGEFYLVQADKAKRDLELAESRSSEFMRENNIVMVGGVDSETAALNALQASLQQARGAAGASDVVAAGRMANDPVVDQIKMQIVTIEDALIQAGERLGPNHPSYKAIEARRALLQKQLAAAEASNRSRVAQVSRGVGQASIGQLERQVADQYNKVLQRRPLIDELIRLEREVQLRRQQYDDSVQAAAKLRVQADVPTVGISALGDPVGSTTPEYPNIPQILILGAVAGLGLGVLTALITEFLARRVRGPEDLVFATGAPVLAVVGAPPPGPVKAWLKRLLRRDDRQQVGETLPQAI
ncbi:MAG: Wzz/FepE/Etk N-terminal domain-containing protein [Thermaurantiacus sp.]